MHGYRTWLARESHEVPLGTVRVIQMKLSLFFDQDYKKYYSLMYVS